MRHKAEPLVSVITPVYNGETYLVECVESVLAQTYQNWEYIIVNNCSNDDTLTIAQRYAQQDPRIRIYNNQDFLKQLENWNQALRQMSAESKYCKVVHADDWLFPECLSRMVEVAETYPSVGIVSAYRLEENEVDLDGLPFPSTFMPGREICRQVFLNALKVFGSPTSLLIRSDLIRSREYFYNEDNIHADKEACFDLLRQSDFGFVHQVLTFTRRHNEALTAFTKRINTFRSSNLLVLKVYGPAYLSQKEYEKCWDDMVRTYYAYLVRNIFEFREKEFWDYHRNVFREMNISFDPKRFVRPLFFEITNRLLHIRTTFHTLVSHFKNNKRRQISKNKKWKTIRSG